MVRDITAKGWRGKIYLPEYLTWAAMLQWERAIEEARVLGETASLGEFYDKLLPVAIGIITKFEIAKLPEPVTRENFPASPQFVKQIVEAITDLYSLTNEDEAPK